MSQSDQYGNTIGIDGKLVGMCGMPPAGLCGLPPAGLCGLPPAGLGGSTLVNVPQPPAPTPYGSSSPVAVSSPSYGPSVMQPVSYAAGSAGRALAPGTYSLSRPSQHRVSARPGRFLRLCLSWASVGVLMFLCASMGLLGRGPLLLAGHLWTEISGGSYIHTQAPPAAPVVPVTIHTKRQTRRHYR